MSVAAFSLAGRVALVTGAGGGLGHGICSSLAAAGASVACVDIDPERASQVAELTGQLGVGSLAIEADVADQPSVEAAVGRTVEEFGGLDVLVNNAAIYPRRPWTEITPQEWDQVLAVNLRGYFFFARACYEPMRQ